MSVLGVIGGSGVYDLDSFKVIEEINTETPFGKPSANIKKISFNKDEFYFIPRHGEGHRLNPSEVNYRANIYAMKNIGVENILSISAVGSLKEEFAPGDFVLPNQFIDWTKGKRSRSFFENGIVGHVSVADPISNELRELIYSCSESVNTKVHNGANYICIEGPQFSTHFESRYYQSIGAEIIGMTNVPEAYLAKEAGINYATIAMITDYDAWKDEHCTVEEIMAVMKKNYISVQKLLEKIIPLIEQTTITKTTENKNAVMTSSKYISEQNQKILNMLLQ